MLKDGPLTKIGHTRDVNRRLARQTDRPTPLTFIAAWSFASVQEAMAHEAAARKLFKPYRAAAVQNGSKRMPTKCLLSQLAATN